jgi:hypothetical protein
MSATVVGTTQALATPLLGCPIIHLADTPIGPTRADPAVPCRRARARPTVPHATPGPAPHGPSVSASGICRSASASSGSSEELRCSINYVELPPGASLRSKSRSGRSSWSRRLQPRGRSTRQEVEGCRRFPAHLGVRCGAVSPHVSIGPVSSFRRAGGLVCERPRMTQAVGLVGS